jgi:hypothetical protein
MVIDGQRNLGEAALQGFLHGLRLMGEERLYFLNLVLWNQSKSQEERARFEGRLNLLRKFRSAKPQAVSLIQKRIEGVRAEIESLLALEFTPEEAIFLAKQFMPESWATSVIVRPPVKKVGSQ